MIPSAVKRPPSVPAKHVAPPGVPAAAPASVPERAPVVAPVAHEPVQPAPAPVESDTEIVKTETPVKPVISDAPPLATHPKAGRPERPNKKQPWLAAKPKVSRATPANQTRLWMNLGAEMDVAAIDVVNVVAGETGLPGKVVGTVDLRERHLFVDVDAEHANAIIAKLNRSEIKGHKVKVKFA